MSADRAKTWKELARGGSVLEPGSYEQVNTGAWRTYVPVTRMDDCIHCVQCWIMCPESARLVKDEKFIGTDLKHCKGCGICANICPVKCIDMKLESEIKEGEPKG